MLPAKCTDVLFSLPVDLFLFHPFMVYFLRISHLFFICISPFLIHSLFKKDCQLNYKTSKNINYNKRKDLMDQTINKTQPYFHLI